MNLYLSHEIAFTIIKPTIYMLIVNGIEDGTVNIKVLG